MHGFVIIILIITSEMQCCFYNFSNYARFCYLAALTCSVFSFWNRFSYSSRCCGFLIFLIFYCFLIFLARMRVHARVFDIGSVLIKPVQRIMKYPLLLQELLKVWTKLVLAAHK